MTSSSPLRPFEVGDLSERERHLWKGVGSSGSGWRRELADFEVAGRWDAIAVIQRAVRSQFDVLSTAARRGAVLPKKVACLALAGDRFHGQRGRPWVALPGNLHLSARVDCRLRASECQAALSMLPTLAVMDSLSELNIPATGIGIKWVNDILIDGRKVSGSLSASEIEGEWITGFTLGIGLNIGRTPSMPPTPFVPRATSLVESFQSRTPPFFAVFRTLLQAIERRFQALSDGGALSIWEDYRDRSCCLGREVRIWEEASDALLRTPPMACGKIMSINPDLSLTIQGHPQPVARGRLVFEAVCRDFGL